MISPEQVREALVPTFFEPDEKGIRRVHFSHFNDRDIADRLSATVEEVRAVADTLVDGENITAFWTHQVGNVPSSRVYFFRTWNEPQASPLSVGASETPWGRVARRGGQRGAEGDAPAAI